MSRESVKEMEAERIHFWRAISRLYPEILGIMSGKKTILAETSEVAPMGAEESSTTGNTNNRYHYPSQLLGRS